MDRLLLVCLGGALGSGARYLVGTAIQGRTNATATFGTLPNGTLAVNLVGSLLIGLLLAAGLEGVKANSWRLLLVTGLLGGFTTYSAFNQETLELLRSGRTTAALTYVATTLVGGLVAGLVGAALGRAIVSYC